MKASFFATVAAAFVSLASAYTTPVSGPSGNPIAKPGLNEQVPIGKPYTITWTPTTLTTDDTITIVLLRGPSTNIIPLYPIVEKIKNTGTYTWTPATDLEIDITHYGLQLIVDSTGEFQWSTQFGISNDGSVPTAPTVPTTTTSSSSSTSTSSTSTSTSTTTTPKVVPETFVTPTTTPGGYPTNGGYVTSGSVVYSTSMVTVTSCGPAVTNCPYKNSTTTTPIYPVPTTYTYPNATVTPIVSPGAGEKVRVGGAMVVVFLAGLSLFL